MIMDDKDDVRERAHHAAEEAAHSATADKAKGRIKEAVGKVKEKVGGAVGDHELEARGTAQRIEGKEHIEAGIDVVKEKIDEARGKK